MGWKVRLASLLAAWAILGGAPASAETQQFAAPSVRGVRLDWCAHFGADCGKPAADLFCKEVGFERAARFDIEQNVGARGIATLVFGDGRMCQGPTCSGFRAITCTKPDQAPLTVSPPTIAITPPKPPAKTLAPILPVLPPSKSPPASAGAINPVIALPAGASLTRCTKSDCELVSALDFDIDPKAQAQTAYFIGDVEKIDYASAFVWQVGTKPFPATGSKNDLKPPGLLSSGEISGKSNGFNIDFKAIVGGGKTRTLPIPRLYVRILPIAGSQIVVGQASNVIGVYYAAEPPPQTPIKIFDPSPPRLFSVRVVSFTPPDFEDPNRWGCVTITGYKETLITFWKDAYPLDTDMCPASFKGDSSYQITSFGGFVDWLTGGVTDALDWASEAYDDLKQIAVDIVMKYTPFGAQCELIGELIDEDAPAYCELAANLAVNAGLAALGLPPSLPNYNELIDQGVDHAVEIAAAKVFEETGYPCVGPCQDALRAGFNEAADQLKTSSYTPGCVGTDEAHAHGREPLCIPDFIIAKPARGAIYTPPIAVVEIRRLAADKNPESSFAGTCSASVGITFEKTLPATSAFGPGTSPKTIEVPAQKVSGALYASDTRELLPGMTKGSTITLTIAFTTPTKYIFPWTKQLWSRSQIPARDEQGPMGPDWFTLYSGAVAKVAANVNCAWKGDTLAYQLPEF